MEQLQKELYCAIHRVSIAFVDNRTDRCFVQNVKKRCTYSSRASINTSLKSFHTFCEHPFDYRRVSSRLPNLITIRRRTMSCRRSQPRRPSNGRPALLHLRRPRGTSTMHRNQSPRLHIPNDPIHDLLRINLRISRLQPRIIPMRIHASPHKQDKMKQYSQPLCCCDHNLRPFY